MVDPLRTLRDHYQHRDRAARDWKSHGGKVVGYICDNVPEELILAAGCLPYRLSGDPSASTTALERYVQSFAAPFSARNRGVGFSDALLAMLLDGAFDFVDFLVIPHSRKSIQAMYRELTQALAVFPDLRLPTLYYLDRAYASSYASEVFNRTCLLEFKTSLEEWSGHRITDEGLGEAIEITNAHRHMLREFSALRVAQPSRVSGVDALQVIGASAFMHTSDHSALVAGVLDRPDLLQSPPPGNCRVFVGGSPIDHVQVYEIVESCGATIVAEDHCWGGRCAEFPADTSMPPFEALADRYHRKPACSIAFPMSTVVDQCATRATRARVDAAIFFVQRGDGVHVWDTPDEIRALHARNIPCLYLAQQPYRIDDPDALRDRISGFVDSLRGASSGV